MRKLDDILSFSSSLDDPKHSNEVRGVLIKKEDNVTLPSGRTLLELLSYLQNS